MIYYAGKMGSKLVKTDVVKKIPNLIAIHYCDWYLFYCISPYQVAFSTKDFMRNFLKNNFS